MIIPYKVTAVLEVSIVPPIDAARRVLELSYMLHMWSLPGLACIWLLSTSENIFRVNLWFRYDSCGNVNGARIWSCIIPLITVFTSIEKITHINVKRYWTQNWNLWNDVFNIWYNTKTVINFGLLLSIFEVKRNYLYCFR